jgi:hypothetical protein
LALPLRQDLAIGKGGSSAPGHQQVHPIQFSILTYLLVIHAVTQFQGRCWPIGMVHHLDGEVFLRPSLFEGFALHPPGDDLRCFVVIFVHQALEASEFGLNRLHFVLTTGRFSVSQRLRADIQIPHRPATGGVFGVDDFHTMPQTPVDGPLLRRLVRLSLGHIRQLFPVLTGGQQFLQGLAVMVLHRDGANVAQAQAQPGQLVLLGGHLAIAEKDDLLQRQEVGQPGMLSEGGKLGGVSCAIPGAAIQSIEPHRQPPVTGGQGEELQLL